MDRWLKEWMDETHRNYKEERMEGTAKFKVGDLVRIKFGRSADSKYFANKEGRIESISSFLSGYAMVRMDDGTVTSGGIWIDELELIDSKSDLQQLVNKGNEGLKALAELSKRDDIEITHFDQVGWDKFTGHHNIISRGDVVRSIRIKPKPTLTPFTTSNGWLVELKDDRLHIGCKSFDVKKFKSMLKDFVEETAIHVNNDDGNFDGSFKGIIHSSHILPWPDAEKLHKELKKVG